MNHDLNRTLAATVTTFRADRIHGVLAGLLLGAAACCSAAAVAAPDAGQGPDAAAVSDLVNKFIEAQVQADAATLRALTAEQYVEISPLGEVDPREKMLGFYVKVPGRVPPVTFADERTVAVFGDSAMVTARMNITRTIEGQARTYGLRMRYVAHKEGGQWKLISMQATPIRPPAPKS